MSHWIAYGFTCRAGKTLREKGKENYITCIEWLDSKLLSAQFYADSSLLCINVNVRVIVLRNEDADVLHWLK